MAWTTPVNVSDVRTEYPLLTSDIKRIFRRSAKAMEFGFARFRL